jgi:hypothetical protein
MQHARSLAACLCLSRSLFSIRGQDAPGLSPTLFLPWAVQRPLPPRQRSAIQLAPKEFEVDPYDRFEGPTNPADESVLYAISRAKFNLKGTLVNGYGIYSEPTNDHILSVLHQKIPG